MNLVVCNRKQKRGACKSSRNDSVRSKNAEMTRHAEVAKSGNGRMTKSFGRTSNGLRRPAAAWRSFTRMPSVAACKTILISSRISRRDD